MLTQDYLNQVGNLIGRDEIPEAISLLQKLLQNSPKLDEAIVQSARYNDLMKQIRMGTIDSEKANTNKNQIRFAILDLTREIEMAISANPQMEAEANAYVQKLEAEEISIQTHYGQGDIIGRDKITKHKNQHHRGTGDNVQGDKTMFISVPIRWTIVVFLCASFFAWYFIWGRPDKMPKANFEYYTEGAKNKVALAGQVVIFNDLSEDAHSVKWTFPNGETFTEKKVLWTFKYYGEYLVKLEAFSRKGKVNEKIVKCQVIPTDTPENVALIRILFEGDEQIRVFDKPLLEIGVVPPGWCDNNYQCELQVVKGQQPYAIHGYAFNQTNGNSTEQCELHGSGTLEFTDHSTYRVFFTNKSSCEMGMEKVPNDYVLPRPRQSLPAPSTNRINNQQMETEMRERFETMRRELERNSFGHN